MPKLNPTKAAEVKKAGEEGSKFTLLPIGFFVVKLTDVEGTESAKGKPMWVWKFETREYLSGQPLVDGKEMNPVGKEVWYRTVIQENTLWDLDRVFAAFDAEPDTDTDELVGDEIVVMIDQSVITGGKSKGKMGNEITEFLTLAEGRAKAESSDFEEYESDEPDF